MMNRYKSLSHAGYEEVVECRNADVGFKAWIAVHNTNLGPALGGCRFWKYHSEDDALFDVLRLSKGMTYKSALAGLPLGGGKAVVMADPQSIDRRKLFEAVGEFVETLDGKYITAEDMNSSLDDMKVIHSRTEHVASLQGSGNPSPMTAYGVFCGIRASLGYKTGSDELNNRVIAVQGVGQTGGALIRLLDEARCRIIVADVDQVNIDRYRNYIGFEVCSPDEIYAVPCDVFVPCAVGGILNDETIPRLNTGIVAGSANNQLLEEKHGTDLMEAGILYAPDFAINAGGVINIGCEINQVYSEDKARCIIGGIAITLSNIYHQATREHLPTNIVANRMAEEVFKTASADLAG